MKAVILVGGKGLRLQPLTCNVAKAMVPILNRPLIEHLLHYLKKHGIRDVILAMGYNPDPIRSYLGDGTQLGVRITYLVEDSPLGTAGAVKNAESLLEKGEPILGYPSKSYWIDIGRPEKYLKVHHDLLFRWNNAAVRIGEDSQIHPAAEIEGPTLIGKECAVSAGARVKGPTVLGQRCKVGEGALVQGAVLWHDSRVGKEAVLRNCVAASHAWLQQGCHVIEGCVVGDNATVEEGSVIWPDNHTE